jgi:hypothetical protein
MRMSLCRGEVGGQPSSMSDEQIPVQPTAIPLAEYCGRWSTILAPLVWVAGFVWTCHLFWHRFDPVISVLIWLPAGSTGIYFRYLRQFRPERAPSMLSEDSEELEQLKRKRTLLNRVGYGGVGLCVVLGSAIRLFTGWHRGEDCFFIPDVLWPWVALPVLVGCVCVFWSGVLEAHIKERRPPAAKPVSLSKGRRKPVVIVGSAFQGNGFHSDHWGERNSDMGPV